MAQELVPEFVSNSGLTNLMLRSLSEATMSRLAPALELHTMHRGDVIARPDQTLEYFYFINRGLVSLVKTMRDGQTIEIAAIGIEGGVDPHALFRLNKPLMEAVVQIPGTAYRIKPEAIRNLAAKNEEFRSVLDRYTRLTIRQITQTAACNHLHSLEQRCCRWLLIAHDNAIADTFPLTHEFLAMMLGVQRAGVSIAAGALQRAGLINYRRGVVTIVKRHALEATACECYRSLQDEQTTLFPNETVTA